MTKANLKAYRLGWVGTGRMGYAMALRLLKNGCDVAVYNRTRAKADPLAGLGATIVDSPADLAERDIVFTMVSGPDDLIEVVTGGNGILSRPDRAPKMLVDCSSVSTEASAAVREQAAARGVAMLAAPVSGNAKVAEFDLRTWGGGGALATSGCLMVIECSVTNLNVRPVPFNIRSSASRGSSSPCTGWVLIWLSVSFARNRTSIFDW